MVQLSEAGKRYSLGTFDCEQEAAKRAAEARQIRDSHPGGLKEWEIVAIDYA